MTQAPRDDPGPDARDLWAGDLSAAWTGDSMYDLQLHPGEEIVVDRSDAEAMAAARRFRDVLGGFASGITVVTAIHDGEPVGMTCQSFSSVSLDPPLVLFIPATTSRAWPMIERAGRFCVNFLAADQAALSDQMAGRGGDKYAGVEWTPAPVTGSPLLAGTVGYVDCELHRVHASGDHYLVLGRVVDLGDEAEVGASAARPLLFFRGAYTTTDRSSC